MDTKKPTFSTTSKMPVSSIIALAVIFLISLTVVDVIALTAENAVSLPTVLLIDLVGIVLLAVLLWISVRTNSWKLDFEGDVLTLTNLGNHKVYVNYDSPISEMKMTLTSAAKDEGKLAITGTIFRIEGIQNFSAMQRYIEMNYRQG